MAIDYLPVTWWTGYADDGTSMKVTFASLDGVATGTVDIRELLLALLEETSVHFETLTGADIPTKMNIQQQSAYDNNAEEINRTFTVRFNLGGNDNLRLDDTIILPSE